MSQVVFCICRNTEGGADASEGRDLLVREHAGREQASFFHSLYIGCQQKSGAQVKGISSHKKKKICILKVDLPALKTEIRIESSDFKLFN